MLELKESDMQELHELVTLYNNVYGPIWAAEELLQDIRIRCDKRGIQPDKGNPRNAGRRKVYPEELNREIIELRQAGWTIRQLATWADVSVGYVQKLISEHEEGRTK